MAHSWTAQANLNTSKKRLNFWTSFNSWNSHFWSFFVTPASARWRPPVWWDIQGLLSMPALLFLDSAQRLLSVRRCWKTAFGLDQVHPEGSCHRHRICGTTNVRSVLQVTPSPTQYWCIGLLRQHCGRVWTHEALPRENRAYPWHIQNRIKNQWVRITEKFGKHVREETRALKWYIFWGIDTNEQCNTTDCLWEIRKDNLFWTNRIFSRQHRAPIANKKLCKISKQKTSAFCLTTKNKLKMNKQSNINNSLQQPPGIIVVLLHIALYSAGHRQ